MALYSVVHLVVPTVSLTAVDLVGLKAGWRDNQMVVRKDASMVASRDLTSVANLDYLLVVNWDARMVLPSAVSMVLNLANVKAFPVVDNLAYCSVAPMDSMSGTWTDVIRAFLLGCSMEWHAVV